MSDLSKRLAELSPEKRELLLKRLQREGEKAPKPAGIPRRPNRDEFPMSFAQMRLWFLDQLEPGSPFYNIAAAVRLEGSLHVPVLVQALQEVVRRHEVLRAFFVTEKGRPVQRLAPVQPLAMPVTSLEHLPAGEREAEARRLIQHEAQKPFALNHGPLLRAGLLKLAERDHLLLLTIHHIVADGWSIGVLIREVATAYQAGLAGRPLRLPDLPIQYADYAAWQRGWLTGEVRARQLDYWKKQLAGVPQLLSLPTDRPRPAVQTFHGAHYAFELPTELLAALGELSRQENGTLFMTLLAAFYTLLYRYSNQDDFCIGTPIANRNRAETEGLIGFFVNTFALRVPRLTDDPPFRELLRRVRETALGAYAHQDLPFEMLIDELQLERHLSHSPLFQVMFVLQSDPLQRLELPDLRLSIMDAETGTAKFDLTLIVEQGPNGWRGIFEYNTDLFLAATVARMAKHFHMLLHGIIADPGLPITALPLLTEAQKRQMLQAWNATKADYPAGVCSHHLFEAQVDKTPAAIAVTFEGVSLTYAELNQRANQLARRLHELGVGPEVLVALCFERSVEMVVAMLTVLKAGGAFVPIDPAYPAERISFMLADCRPAVLLTQSALAEKLPATTIPKLFLDEGWEQKAGQPAVNFSGGARPENLAYVIYTSGSTGRPKGVLVPHRGLNNFMQSQKQDWGLGPHSRVLQFASFSFDAAISEIFGTLLNGGTLVLARREIITAAADLHRCLQENHINTVTLPPSLLAVLSNQGLPELHTIISAGESCPWEVAARWSPGRKFFNGYGPTETTIAASWEPAGEKIEGTLSVPLGRPFQNVQIYLLDARLQPVPIGVPGELHIGGAGVARGYLNRPDLTAEKFIPHPFSDEPGARLYKSGDLARYLPDGRLEFLGRLDHQVKLRGFRIELEEIEAVLRQHPAVREAVVLARDETGGGKQLVAYLTAAVPAEPSVSELRHFLRDRLPEYMIPAWFVTLPAFPLTASGKIDRRALPAPDRSRPEQEKAYVAPRTALERFLAQVWQDVLGVEKVGVYDNFFEIGGDSIRSAVLVNRVQEVLGETFPVRAVFHVPTVAEMALYLAEYYPEIVAQKWGSGTVESLRAKLEAQIVAPAGDGRIDAATVARFQALIPPLPRRDTTAGGRIPKNRPAIFLLSPPRSGSTLLRVMLAGHPRLFSPPELELLSFNTLQERRQALSQTYELWLEATVRAVMELKNCDAATAGHLMAEYERQNLSVKEFYGLLQTWLGDRLLVDKTPSYALDPEILRRAESDFDEPLYLHLVRHPYATIYSFIEAKLDQNFFRYPHPFTRRELAELIWIVCHRNILDFLATIPPQRQFRLKFEEVLADPRAEMEKLCAFLGLEFHPDMLKPYEGKRMTDPVKADSQMVGDFKFYLRKTIDTSVTDRWRKFHTQDFLSSISWELAARLGYAREESAGRGTARQELTGLQPIPRTGELPLSFAQQRLWFLDQLEPNNPFYNVIAAVRLLGELQEAALLASLNEILRRHEILRTAFHTVEGKPKLEIAPAGSVTVPVSRHDLRHLPVSEREARVQALASEEARRPFQLTSAPLLRGLLLQLDEQEHVLVLTMHHIVADGWSVNVFNREMAALYPAFAAGQPSPLPELPIQYLDYAHWQRQWLASGVLETQLHYWKRQLAGVPALLELPADHPRPAVQSHRGGRLAFEIAGEPFDRLHALSRRENVTTFMILLAALQTLLHRYTRQTDIAVGTPVANRNRSEIEPLIGLFVNTLVLRSDLSGDPTFHELLARVRQVALDAYAHPDVPFEKLVDELQPQRDMSHTPLFQVMFAHHRAVWQTIDTGRLKLQPLVLDTGTAKFDLTLEIVEREDRLKGAIEYNADLFEVPTIQRMIAHFQTLLAAAVTTPDMRLSQLPLLPAAERRLVLEEWSTTASVPLPEACFPELFAAQAAATPGATAVVYENDRITYGELNRRANQLAHYLQKLGAGPETLVGLCLERSVEMIVGLVGILKAGAAYVPLDPGYPAERLALILQDAKAPVLVTQEGLLRKLPKEAQIAEAPAGLQAVCLDRDWPVIARAAESNPECRLTPEHPAYVIYTSGSTGRPKGVMIRHRGVLNLLAGLEHAIYAHHPTRPLRASLNAPLPFDASVQQLVLLLRGHALHIIPQEVRLDGEALLLWLRQHRLDVFDCVPSQLKLLLNAGLLESEGLPAIMLPGGEAIDAATWNTLAQAKATAVYNMYGPTECTVDSTIARVHAGQPPNIGRPIVNVRHYVLDAALQPLPIGVPGELHIGGADLARGYFNRPDLTAAKFIPDPFSSEPGSRLYKTGDVVRWLPDGRLEFLGRIDDQVKLRGFRIELGEIEATLSQHPAVQEAVVLVREETGTDGAAGSKRLVAYVVPAGETEPAVGDLRQFLKERLPEYMVPAVFVTLPALPRLPNGKIDRRNLPAPTDERPELAEGWVAPRNEVEARLAEIWQQVLGVKQIGVHDNFFELGGDSILSIQVIARARQAGLPLTPRQLFQNPTIAGLAPLCEAAVTTTIHAEQGTISGPVPLTPIQRWFFEQNFAAPHHWNQSILLEVRQRLAPQWLAQAVHRLVEHHDALRLRFTHADSGWQQHNADSERANPFTFWDLSALTPEAQRVFIENKAADLQASLDLIHGPLLRVAYFDRGAEAPGRLLIIVHHLVIDGVSWRILLEDFLTAYRQLSEGRPVQLPPKTTSFQYWAQRLVTLAQSATLQQQLDFWRAQCELCMPELPLDFTSAGQSEAAAGTVMVTLPAEETSALLQEVPAAFHTRIDEALLTALARVLARWTGRRTLLIDYEGHGREPLFDDVDLSRTVGWFTSIHPLALDLGNTLAFVDALKTIKEQMRRVPQGGVGWGLLRYLSDNRSLLREVPPAPVIFNYLGQFDHVLPPDGMLAVAPESHGPERAAHNHMTHALDLSAGVRQQQLHLQWKFNPRQFARRTIEKLAHEYVAELRLLVQQCRSGVTGGYTPSDFAEAGLSQEELDRVLAEVTTT
ncbi:MAG: amino acid adenylation domain-containing protein [candidate division KSB1 bacterium]|nr:amino acid adenylation domain-containing protein [candidate division KSB1 bacterium]MDZ7273651.1 amino acid adenylation domain-containing protein [candidate division KSB1 bacterium]MDZ7286758.1 amino acid adenylation domain-containing protein [candidate division KSB1 bacterium]MDZ7299885.1 amino acid adenylation domain-containing protein [candidate division KSB1 bacterium]MDZ7350788.1 amino acid adenylation domain-containing protein [candidate division KSB1 bacterium]